jgi:Putative beta-barrel porin-2, OmpL-like. bbp2/Carboxypeptidase regulatory-like domain
MRVYSARAAAGLLAALLGLGTAEQAWAQQTNVNASIVGTVHDASGQPVAGAQVVFRNLGTDVTQTVGSDAHGKYGLHNMVPGSYEVTASKYGFIADKVRVTVEAHREWRTNFKLKVSGIKETDTAASSAANASPEDKKLDALEARIDQLEAELRARPAQPVAVASAPVASASTPAPQQESAAVFHDSAVTHGPLLATLTTKDSDTLPVAPGKLGAPDMSKTVATAASPDQQAALPPSSAASGSGSPQNTAPPANPPVDTQTPFAYADFTWLNGTPRNKDVVVDTPFFTPEIRFDTNFINDFNQPIDHTMGGSTEEFRNGEFQVEDIGIGGDFHWQNVRGRVMFMDGLFAVTTPRNDASSATGTYPGETGGVGQWDLQDAYKYVSEAYGGYHFNVQHGINVDAGIFVSYVGLFSYYNFDNWVYQPSYVSSNTPWFFQGVRIQWFPTNKLKIEPWIINGWQSYAKYNGHLGLGGQLLWMPTEWFKLVANQYGYGEDNLGLPKTQRIHTDDSIEVRYYNKPEKMSGIDKMAFSLTGDAGCQYGGGISCTGGPNKESFLGWMGYQRMWWHHDVFALTVGGGQMNNPGRYLTLLPPIDGAWAAVGSAYFPETPGSAAVMYDSTLTFQYMPKEYITWWAELGYRHSNVPYFSGRGGITPPGGNNGDPQYFTCMSGATSGTANLAAAETACGGGIKSVWFPDLRESTSSLGFGVMVKF